MVYKKWMKCRINADFAENLIINFIWKKYVKVIHRHHLHLNDIVNKSDTLGNSNYFDILISDTLISNIVFGSFYTRDNLMFLNFIHFFLLTIVGNYLSSMSN